VFVKRKNALTPLKERKYAYMHIIWWCGEVRPIDMGGVILSFSEVRKAVFLLPGLESFVDLVHQVVDHPVGVPLRVFRIPDHGIRLEIPSAVMDFDPLFPKWRDWL
jgi:hypothetical protein